jgi:hypothetical protein
MEPHLTEEEIILLVERTCDPRDADRFYNHLRHCGKCLDDFQYMTRTRITGDAVDVPDEIQQSLVELGKTVEANARSGNVHNSGKTDFVRSTRRRKWIYGVAVAAALVVVSTTVWIKNAETPSVGLDAELTNPVFEAMTVASNRSFAVIPGTENSITTTHQVYRSGFVVNDEATSNALLSLAKRYQEGEASRDVVYWLLAGFLATGQFDGARDILDTALRQFPEDAEIVTLSGLVAYYEGELDEAEVLFRSVVERSPDDAVATVNLGVVLMGKGDHVRAKTVLARVAVIRPATPLTKRARWLLAKLN